MGGRSKNRFGAFLPRPFQAWCPVVAAAAEASCDFVGKSHKREWAEVGIWGGGGEETQCGTPQAEACLLKA